MTRHRELVADLEIAHCLDFLTGMDVKTLNLWWKIDHAHVAADLNVGLY